MAAKFFTGLPLAGPDPECVQGYGVTALARDRNTPRPTGDHSRSRAIPLRLITTPPARPCNESPV